MDLADYLDALHNGDRQRQTNIVLPAALVSIFDDLYQKSETAGLEHGCYLLYDPTTRMFTRGEIDSGHKDHMDIPGTNNANNFGNAHGHPSKAVGHDGGYSAHSPEDLSHFEEYKDRDHFIQFVAAGPRVYAMIFTNGMSTWTEEVDAYLVTGSAEVIRANRSLLFDKAGGEDAFVERMQGLAEDEAATEEWLMGLRKQVPDYGRRVQQHSVDFCKRFADTWQYQFLSWHKTGGTCTIL